MAAPTPTSNARRIGRIEKILAEDLAERNSFREETRNAVTAVMSSVRLMAEGQEALETSFTKMEDAIGKMATGFGARFDALEKRVTTFDVIRAQARSVAVVIGAVCVGAWALFKDTILMIVRGGAPPPPGPH